MTTPDQNPSNQFSPFLGTTLTVPEDPEQLNSFLNDQFARYADVINQKTIGTITPAENFSGQTWSYIKTNEQRNGFQVIAYIPNMVTQTLDLIASPIPFPIKGIDPNFVVTQVWGSASKPCSAKGAGDGVYFSFYSQGDARITFTMSDIAIVITSVLVGYSGFIVIQYLRNGK
jgi:hypothetical protein